MKKIVVFLLSAALLYSLVLLFSQNKKPLNQSSSPAPTSDTEQVKVIAKNLEVPWALAFLPASPQGGPDRSILFTERAGRVRFIDKKANLDPKPIAIIEDVLHDGEGGLLGIEIHPDFSRNHFVYLYYTYANDNGQTLNRVVRFKFKDNIFSDKTIIVDEIPGASNHNGGRIKFGPDKFLYITTGDSQNPSLAQDKNSKAGKILRVTQDGKPATSNPFGNEIYSYGHRNPQGITWDDNGRLWTTEHGPSTLDELNIINIGKNYGWPNITGDQTAIGMETSIFNSGSDTWAPSGAAYLPRRQVGLNNSIFFAGLRGQALYEAVIDGNEVVLKEHLKGEVGRIREVVAGPDNLLYITTSNRDGRGIPDGTDDKIIRINPAKL